MSTKLISPDDLEAAIAEAVEEIVDPASADLTRLWDEEWSRHLLEAASQRVKRLVKPKQFQVFDFYVLKGLPATRVARELGVSLAQVYLAKHRVGRLLEHEVRQLEKTGI